MELSQKRPVMVAVKNNMGSGTSSKPSQCPDQTFEKPQPRRAHTHHSVEINTYFKGPRDMNRHSKYPFFLRLYGSVVPKMILPLFVVVAWATTITSVSEIVVDLGIDHLLLTVLGFVVALALSFRSSTAYERYSEGRRLWDHLIIESRDLSRLFWINTPERHSNPDTGRADLLAKLNALNLIHAFAVSLKHRLRFEPATDYPDLRPLVSHLDTFAGAADQPALLPHGQTPWHATAQYLGLSFATSNPRKMLKRSSCNLGNLPLEILSYLAAYVESLVELGLMPSTAYQGRALGSLAALTAILSGTERITNTPLSIAYSIAISQITWLYVLALPFQLVRRLHWVAIPGTVVAAYIILGLAAIGREIENPFGDDVNDLPLDVYCRELKADLDVLCSMAPAGFRQQRRQQSGGEWDGLGVEEIREVLRGRAVRGEMMVGGEGEMGGGGDDDGVLSV